MEETKTLDEITIEDGIDFEENLNEIYLSLFIDKFKDKIQEDFKKDYSLKFIAYIIEDEKAKKIYESEYSQKIKEFINIEKIMDEQKIKNYIFIVGIYDEKFNNNLDKKSPHHNESIQEETVNLREQLRTNVKEKVKKLRKYFWKNIKSY